MNEAEVNGSLRPPRGHGHRVGGLPGALWLLPLLALYVVVWAVWQPGLEPVRDEGPLLGYAQQILEGGYVQDDGESRPMRFLWHTPGLPLLLAPLVALDLPLGAIRFAGPLLMAAAVVAFHGLLRLRLSPARSLGWSYALGLYAPAIAMVPELHKDLLAVLLVVVAMLAVTRGLPAGRKTALLAAGVALGALALTRGEYGWVLIGLVALGAPRLAFGGRGAVTARRLLVSGVVALALCVPWLAYTHQVTGEAFYWGNSAGLSLFWMSPTVPGETGEWHPARHVLRDPALYSQRRLFRRLRTLESLEADLLLRRLAVANVRADPWHYARNLVANASRLFFFVPMRYQYPGWIVAGAALFNAALLAAVAWAGVRLWRRRGLLPPETGPFALFAVLGVAVHLPASANPRMLLPLVPILIWFVAQAHGRGRGPRLRPLRGGLGRPVARNASVPDRSGARELVPHVPS